MAEQRQPIRAHSSVGRVPTTHAGVYAAQAQLTAMHGRRVPVDPPRPVLLHLLWGEDTRAVARVGV